MYQFRDRMVSVKDSQFDLLDSEKRFFSICLQEILRRDDYGTIYENRE